MAYRYGNRNQQELFPKAIEEYVAEDDPVRAYDAFVEALDFNNLKIILMKTRSGIPSIILKQCSNYLSTALLTELEVPGN